MPFYAIKYDPEADRTPNLTIKSRLLCQLSYGASVILGSGGIVKIHALPGFAEGNFSTGIIP